MKVSNLIRFAFSKHSRYLIVGGGTGGVSISSHLLRSGVSSKEITIIDPSPYHYYQPGWTMVGAGQWLIHSTEKKMEDTIPKNVPLSKERIKVVKPEENKVIC
jgi:sulfide:quinone oxidoreductase